MQNNIETGISKWLDQQILEYGNKRFVEGWEGAIEHIAGLIESGTWVGESLVEDKANLINLISEKKSTLPTVKTRCGVNGCNCERE